MKVLTNFNILILSDLKKPDVMVKRAKKLSDVEARSGAGRAVEGVEVAAVLSSQSGLEVEKTVTVPLHC